jgi:hypothetical protein
MDRSEGQSILMDTARGTPIPNAQDDEIPHPLAPEHIATLMPVPSVTRVERHFRYNCHGLTFAARRTSIYEPADVLMILAEDGYERVVNPEDVLPGDCVLYFNEDGEIEHSGIVVSRPEGVLKVPEVCSKFGPGGPELLHMANNCGPYPIINIRYYRAVPPAKHAQ